MLDLKMELPTDREISQMFDIVGHMKRYSAYDKVTLAMGRVVAARAKVLCPKSSETGTADKRAKKQRSKGKWDVRLWTTIRAVGRKTNTGGYAIVGPKHPDGNKVNFNTARKKKSRRVWFWGKDQHRTVPAIPNFLVQAADETKPQQLSAGKASLEKFIKTHFGK